jgi:hypothetical protein
MESVEYLKLPSFNTRNDYTLVVFNRINEKMNYMTTTIENTY